MSDTWPGRSDDLNACAALLERGDPDRFAALLTAPLWARERLVVLWAFNLEVARAPWVVKEPLLGQIRLAWWREAVEEIAAGARPRAHEVVRPLAALVAETGLAIDDLHSVIAARHWDLDGPRPADIGALVEHLRAGSGALAALGASALGVPADRLGAARAAGTGQGMAAWLAAAAELRARGRRPLPCWTEDCVRAAAAAGLAEIRRAKRGGTAGGEHALRAGWAAAALLKRAARRPAEVLDGAVQLSPLRKRAGLLMRAISGSW